jgi:hypothetical protein
MSLPRVEKFWEENMKKIDLLVSISVDGILMKRILTTYVGKTWTGFSRLTTTARGVFFCKHGTGISFSIKCGKLLDNYYILGDSHTQCISYCR